MATDPEKRGMHRRSFMQTLGAAGAVGAATTLVPTLSSANPDEEAGFEVVDLAAEGFPEDEAPVPFPGTADEYNALELPEIERPVLDEGFEYGDDALVDEWLEAIDAGDDIDALDARDLAREIIAEQKAELAARRREVYVKRTSEQSRKRAVRTELQARRQQEAARKRAVRASQEEQRKSSRNRLREEHAKSDAPAQVRREAHQKRRQRNQEQRVKQSAQRTLERRSLEKERKALAADRAEWREARAEEREAMQARRREARAKRLTLRRRAEQNLKSERQFAEENQKMGRAQEQGSKRRAAEEKHKRAELDRDREEHAKQEIR
ncbi:MAG: twin-arginine translocation signal domain-containing protein [Bradymonadia bacterium]